MGTSRAGSRLISPAFSGIEVVRFVSGLPFDVAADAVFLVFPGRLSGQQGIDGGREISARGGTVVGAAVIVLAAVGQLVGAVVEEEVRGAGGAVALGHILALVVQVGEGVAGAGNLLETAIEAVRVRATVGEISSAIEQVVAKRPEGVAG